MPKIAKRNTRPTERSPLVPDTDILAAYVSRSFGRHSDFDIYSLAMEKAKNVLLEGPTGPGKTMSVQAFAAKRSLNFYSVPCNAGVDPTQLFGKYVPDEDTGGFRWQDGGVTRLVRDGGVLLINEVNFMPERVSTVLFSLLDRRRYITLLDHEAEPVHAHRPDGCWCSLPAGECRTRWLLVVADMNPEYEGTRALNKAFRNRFAIQLDWDYDPVVEAQLVSSEPLREVAQGLRACVSSGDFVTPTSTNMLMEFEELIRLFDLDFAIQNLVQHYTLDERPVVADALKAKHDNLKLSYEDQDDETDDETDEDNPFLDDDWIVADETPSPLRSGPSRR